MIGRLAQDRAPIHPVTGNGNQKVYLAEIGRSVFDLLTGGAAEIVDTPAYREAAIEVLSSVDDTIECALAADPGMDTTTKRQSIPARQWQGVFRSGVPEIERGCV